MKHFGSIKEENNSSDFERDEDLSLKPNLPSYNMLQEKEEPMPENYVKHIIEQYHKKKVNKDDSVQA